ncbi:MAG: class I SAM-dependent methyltransferase [Proteobacteria bacterium]|jgi:2-polyprenyl-3-methyl-5-hydroxy-6-metoxy-1,4-benzoquinol methylase|nr:class I SAM-dependent methyltransferase [Pseudomonadota bacterium]
MNTHSQDATLPQEVAPWLEPWPTDQLEALGQCPICGDTSRKILHADLVDNTFYCAPGVWQLFRCERCCSLYLDPQPSEQTIGTAYKQYYTHSSNESVDINTRQHYSSLSLLRKLRRRLVNGYTNRRFGTSEHPEFVSGILLGLLPKTGGRLIREFRSLPGPNGSQRTLLDLGCGDGDFLRVASTCGWEAIGVDPDPSAVKTAVKRGFQAYVGGIDFFEGQSCLFDAIQLSHVIEHLHHPQDVLDTCLRLLKPGGMIWIETPNAESPSLRLWGKHWRAFEAPRHLQLFTHSSLISALSAAGFESIEDGACNPFANSFICRASYAMRLGHSPLTDVHVPMRFLLATKWYSALGTISPRRRDFLTLTGHKPHH